MRQSSGGLCARGQGHDSLLRIRAACAQRSDGPPGRGVRRSGCRRALLEAPGCHLQAAHRQSSAEGPSWGVGAVGAHHRPGRVTRDQGLWVMQITPTRTMHPNRIWLQDQEGRLGGQAGEVSPGTTVIIGKTMRRFWG